MPKLSFLVFLLCCTGLSAQTSPETYYRYGNQFLALPQLDLLDLPDWPKAQFKRQSIYAKRFDGLSVDKLNLGSALFEILPNHGLRWTQLNNQATVVLPNEEEKAEGGGQHFLVQAEKTMVYVKHLSGSQGFVVYGYDAQGQVQYRRVIEHTKLIRREKLEYYKPYKRYLTHTFQHLIFSSYDRQLPETTVMDLATGDTLQYPFAVLAPIRGGDEKELWGFVLRPDAAGNAAVYWLKSGYPSLNLSLPQGHNAVETIVLGNLCLVLSYPDGGAGVQIQALSLQTGQVDWRWTMPAATEKRSFQSFWFSAYGDYLILEGYHSAGRSLHILQAKDGQLLKNW